jgi:hypothetical protein
MKLILSLFLGFCAFTSLSCSEKKADEITEAGHTTLATSAAPTIRPDNTDKLSYLSKYLGQQPDSVNLWETEPLRFKLEELLGNDLATFLKYMQHAAPLQQERVFYTISKATNKNFAFILVDPDADKVHVSIVEDGIRKQYQTPGEDFYLPNSIEQLL